MRNVFDDFRQSRQGKAVNIWLRIRCFSKGYAFIVVIQLSLVVILHPA